MIDRLCIIGVGMIGGSIARSAKGRGICREVVGVDANLENLNRAKALSVIDFGERSIREGVVGAELVIIATPVGTIRSVLKDLEPIWSEHAVYTDVGSTKVCVIEALRDLFGAVPLNFIPGHPIAGSEKSGVDAALPDLFLGKRVVLTPESEADPKAVRKVERFWSELGATVSSMDVRHHDSVLAATSHLPHVIAYALTDLLGRKDEKDEIFRFAAGGFKDFTRIASSDPKMWMDICSNNRDEIVTLIEQMIEELDDVASLLKEKKYTEIYDIFSRAKAARNRFMAQYNNP